MPVAADNGIGVGSQSAFYIYVVFGIVQKRPEAEPGRHQSGASKYSIKNGINVTMTEPRFFAKDSGPFQEVFIFKRDSR